MARAFVLAVLVVAAPAAARAADAPLPLLVTVPPPVSTGAAQTVPALSGAGLDVPQPESIYRGLYVGSEIYGVSGRGIKSGIGGDVYAGYDRVLGNGVLVGIQGTTGYGPALWGRPGLKGFDFGEASAQVAYPMGRLTPFVTAGLVVARPVTGPGLAGNTTDSFNDLLNGSGDLYAAPRVGAGFAYALTTTTSVSLGVSVGRGVAGALP